jgi:two-component system response regulator FixJ
MYSDSIVYIVDDNGGIRDSVSLLLRSVGLVAVTCASAQEFLDVYDPSRAGCLVLDIRMPDMGGLELQQKLVDKNCPLPIIVITGHADVLLAVRAMKAGAIDFFEKPFNDQLLLDSISTAIDRSIGILREQRQQADYHAKLERLSPREREVMDLLVEGNGTKEVASILGISPKTVGVHRGNILGKIQAKSVHQLVLLNLSLGDGVPSH